MFYRWYGLAVEPECCSSSSILLYRKCCVNKAWFDLMISCQSLVLNSVLISMDPINFLWKVSRCVHRLCKGFWEGRAFAQLVTYYGVQVKRCFSLFLHFIWKFLLRSVALVYYCGCCRFILYLFMIPAYRDNKWTKRLKAKIFWLKLKLLYALKQNSKVRINLRCGCNLTFWSTGPVKQHSSY